MPKSMTGYGRGEAEGTFGRISVEIKAVNNRYLDINIRLPRKYSVFESDIRAFLKQRIFRGKVDVYLNEERNPLTESALSCRPALAKSYVDGARALAAELGIDEALSASDLLRLPEVFTTEERGDREEEVSKVLFPALSSATDAFLSAAALEGESLKTDLLKKLDLLSEDVSRVIAREPKIVEEYRQRCFEKVNEILSSQTPDEGQLLTAAVLYADKVSTDEETIRLQSHIQQMRDALENEEEGIGRKLDFLSQEMNREANTILSKAGDLITADIGIEMKTTIEKIREQIQNLA